MAFRLACVGTWADAHDAGDVLWEHGGLPACGANRFEPSGLCGDDDRDEDGDDGGMSGGDYSQTTTRKKTGVFEPTPMAQQWLEPLPTTTGKQLDQFGF